MNDEQLAALDTLCESLLRYYPVWRAKRIAASLPVPDIAPERVIASLNLPAEEDRRLLDIGATVPIDPPPTRCIAATSKQPNQSHRNRRPRATRQSPTRERAS